MDFSGYKLVVFVKDKADEIPIEAVPSAWIYHELTRNKLMCYYPPNPSKNNEVWREIRQMIRTQHPVNKSWPVHEVNICGAASSWKEVTLKLKELEEKHSVFTTDPEISKSDQSSREKLKYKMYAAKNDPKQAEDLFRNAQCDLDKRDDPASLVTAETSLRKGTSSKKGPKSIERPPSTIGEPKDSVEPDNSTSNEDIEASASSFAPRSSLEGNTSSFIVSPIKKSKKKRVLKKRGKKKVSMSSRESSPSLPRVPKSVEKKFTKQKLRPNTPPEKNSTTSNKKILQDSSNIINSTGTHHSDSTTATPERKRRRSGETSEDNKLENSKRTRRNSFGRDDEAFKKIRAQSEQLSTNNTRKNSDQVRKTTSDILGPVLGKGREVSKKPSATDTCGKSNRTDGISFASPGKTSSGTTGRTEKFSTEKSAQELKTSDERGSKTLKDTDDASLAEAIIESHENINRLLHQAARLKGQLIEIKNEIIELKSNRAAVGNMKDLDTAVEMKIQVEETELPCKSLADFNIFDDKLRADELARKTVLLYIHRMINRDRSMARNLGDTIRQFMTQEVGNRMTTMKKMPGKDIFTKTKLCGCFFAIYSRYYGEPGKVMARNTFLSAMRGVLNNAGDWNGGRSQRDKGRKRNQDPDFTDEDVDEF